MTWIEGYLLCGILWAALSRPLTVIAKQASGWILALYPAVGFCLTLLSLKNLGITNASHLWVPELGIRFATGLDALGALFWLMISGIGTLVYIFTTAYMKKDHERLFPPLVLFTVSMLVVTCAQDMATLFVAWELTSLTSFVLIGFNTESTQSRKAAFTALAVTGFGGLALLAGIALLANENHSFAFSELKTASPWAIGLVTIGCLTKSAQFPFHFWLPGAMVAPTPVSAYLHSATMVKAGVFLLAKFSPLFGTQPFITAVGTITLVIGSLLSLTERDMKRILAWSTVAALGSMVTLIGLGTEHSSEALVVTILAHACYKGALFMSSGSIDFALGTRDAASISGFAKSSVALTIGMVLSGMSMAGVPILLGFVAKEASLRALGSSPIVFAFLLSGVCNVIVAINTAIRPLLPLKPTHSPPKTPINLALGTLVLGGLGATIPLALSRTNQGFLNSISSQVAGKPFDSHLVAFHGFNTKFYISLSILAVGAVAALFWKPFLEGLRLPTGLSSQSLYIIILQKLQSIGSWIGKTVESRSFRQHLVGYIIVFIALAWYVFVARPFAIQVDLQPEIKFNEIVIAAFAVIASLGVILSRKRMGGVAILGIVGVSITLTYVTFSAPDLALTQLLIEVLTVVLFVIIFAHLPALNGSNSLSTKLRDATVAGLFGMTVAVLVFGVLSVPKPDRIASYFADKSYELAKGKNVVNTIIVDFRGLDTLGEITVLCVAALGVHTLIRFRRTSNGVTKAK